MINQNKIREWAEIYLKHIEEVTVKVHVQNEEGYKFKAVENFQKNFNIDAENLAKMLDLAVANNNLAVGSRFFPRLMLLHFAAEYPVQTRDALRILFDETKAVKTRIDDTNEIFNSLISEINTKTDKNKSHFIDVRFLSLLLAYKYPDKYNALKPREWRNFCKYIDEGFSFPKRITDGEQYEMYQPYIEELRRYIKTIPEIDKIRQKLTEGLDFHDDEFRWITQDIIYVTSRIIEEEYGADNKPTNELQERPKTDNEEDGDTRVTLGDRFMYEEDLQLFFEENFNKISFQDHLTIYTDTTGKQGYYYPADGDEIDILATDETGDFVVIELKRERAADHAVNQLSRYLQWVEKNLAVKLNKKVRGILITHSCSRSLLRSVDALRYPVKVMLYSIKIDLNEFTE